MAFWSLVAAALLACAHASSSPDEPVYYAKVAAERMMASGAARVLQSCQYGYRACAATCGGGCCPTGTTCRQNSCCPSGSSCSDDCSGLSTGAIIAIVVCSIAAILAVAGFLLRRQRIARMNALAAVAGPPPPQMVVLPTSGGYPGTTVMYVQAGGAYGAYPSAPQPQLHVQPAQGAGMIPVSNAYPPETDAPSGLAIKVPQAGKVIPPI